MSKVDLSKATARPWQLHSERPGEFVAGNFLYLPTCPGKGEPEEVWQANAALIVQAVNSFEALREALQACQQLFAKDHALDHFDWGKAFLRAEDIQELNELPGQIRLALKLAEEEKT